MTIPSNRPETTVALAVATVVATVVGGVLGLAVSSDWPASVPILLIGLGLIASVGILLTDQGKRSRTPGPAPAEEAPEGRQGITDVSSPPGPLAQRDDRATDDAVPRADQVGLVLPVPSDQWWD